MTASIHSHGLRTILAACLLAPAAAAGAAEVRARFIGNMAVQLTDGRVTLRTDFPYEPGAFGYMSWTDALVPAPVGEVLCLVTHSHRDHFLPAQAARYCTKLVGPADVRAALEERALGLTSPVAFGPLAITPLRTPHGPLEHYSYLVEWDGLRLYFSGDTEDTSVLLRQRGLDVAFVSPWLLRSVASQGSRIDARRLIVYHHQQGELVPELHGRELPRQGEELVFRKE